MKSVTKYIAVLFVLCSCNNSNNSELPTLNKDTVLVYKHDTINYSLPYACVAGVNNGKSTKGELVNCGGMILKNNSSDYKVVSFVCRDILNDINYKQDNQVKNIGPIFNKNVIKLFQQFDCDAKFCFENIKVVGLRNDTVVLNPVIIDVTCEEVK